MCVSVLPAMYVYEPHVCLVYRGQKKALDPLELEYGLL